MRGLIVLGATGGLAQTFLPLAAAQGFALVLQGRRRDVLSTRAAALEHAVVVAGEADEPDMPERLWKTCMGQGEPFGLVSMVGAAGRMTDAEWTPATFASLFQVNSGIPLWHVHRWAQRMRAAGLAGNAVVLSTMQAVYPFEGSLPYALSKAGLERAVEVLAKDHGPSVRINAVAPGVNEAGMALASIQKGKYQPYLDRKTIARYGRAEDVAQAILFLLQPDLYMTGQTLLVDGGLTLRRDMNSG